MLAFLLVASHIIVPLVFIGIIILAIAMPKIKGHVGESIVAKILERLPSDEYKVLDNVMLRTDYGTTQIDHIVVSAYGIFVIETKNYKGWITGGQYSEYWRKHIYNKKYKFHNPIKQNYGHIKALEEILKVSNNSFHSIIVFIGTATLKVNTTTPVIYPAQLLSEILLHKEKLPELQNPNNIVAKLITSDIFSKDTQKEHIKKVSTAVIEKKTKLKHRICPKCGGNLVERNGKYGEFIGCDNYPECKFTIRK